MDLLVYLLIVSEREHPGSEAWQELAVRALISRPCLSSSLSSVSPGRGKTLLGAVYWVQLSFSTCFHTPHNPGLQIYSDSQSFASPVGSQGICSEI